MQLFSQIAIRIMWNSFINQKLKYLIKPIPTRPFTQNQLHLQNCSHKTLALFPK